jgi:protein-S-isoprenylcysteine O-methyltransferase Ste14
MKTISVAGLLLMIAAAAILYAVHSLVSRSPAVIAAQVVAVALMLWARATFGGRSFHASADPTAGGLVTTGPYRFIRHPIYTAACLFCWAGILANPTPIAIGAGVLLIAGTLMRMFMEERLVAERYPDYREYAKKTKRMVPYLF